MLLVEVDARRHLDGGDARLRGRPARGNRMPLVAGSPGHAPARLRLHIGGAPGLAAHIGQALIAPGAARRTNRPDIIILAFVYHLFFRNELIPGRHTPDTLPRTRGVHDSPPLFSCILSFRIYVPDSS